MSEFENCVERRLVLFTRFPEPGRTKTRLIPLLGPEGAAALQREMTERTLRRVAPPAAGRVSWDVAVRHEGGDAERMRAWLGGGHPVRSQGPGDLGARLALAFEEGFAAGAAAVVVIGADCPELGAGDVADGFRALEDADAVLGPARDGGYYLVGLRRSARESVGKLFARIPWGGPGVLAASTAAATGAGLSVALLRTLADVDRPEDLPVWEKAVRDDAIRPLISVVIPALEEAGRIGALVDALRAVWGVEVLVADGGSADETPALAAGHGARVIVCGRGRAIQMNAGAAAAMGEILLFLHADTQLPAGWADAVREALRKPSVGVGAFSFATDSPLRSLRAIERLANWRGRRLGIVFGDQALFCRRGDFEAAGGFPEQPLLEDWELVRRLRRRGKAVILPQAVVTSARRWHERGPWRTSLKNASITLAYLGGVPPAPLARWYRRVR
jgi:rSAM/selenodomain-associated transferase 2/rSAM/selenodomain-associated transferase 1